MSEPHDALPTVRSDDEMLDAVARGENITQDELGRILVGVRGEMQNGADEDAFGFFARELPEAPAPVGDVVGKLLVVMFLACTLGFFVSAGLVFVSTFAALCLSMPCLALSLTTVIIATVVTPK